MKNPQELTPEELHDLPPQEEPLAPEKAQPPEEPNKEPSTSSALNWFLASAILFFVSLIVYATFGDGFINTSVLGIFPLLASLWAGWMGVNTILKE